jgi:hypothetical protein
VTRKNFSWLLFALLVALAAPLVDDLGIMPVLCATLFAA